MPNPPRAVAVLRFSSLGDIVLAFPALAALRLAWPNTQIFFVTHAHFAPLLQDNPHINGVIALPRGSSWLAVRQRLRELQVDAVLDLHGKARGWLLRHTLPLRRRAVWNKRPLRQSLAVKWGGARYHAEMHIAARYHQAVERLVGRALPRQPMRYYCSSAAVAAASKALTQAGIVAGRPVVGMAPGAMWETKRWPAERFAALARTALAQGAQVVLTGSPGEAQLCATIAALAPGTRNLAGQLELPVLASIIAACAVFVANDSGPMHLARALAVPTLAIFGSTDPGQFDFTGHALLYAGVDCSPCSFHGLAQCPRGHLQCMGSLDVGKAEQALRSLLTRHAAPPVLG